MLDAENEDGFNAAMKAARSQWGPAMEQEVAWRAKPYGVQPSDYATFKRVEEFRLGDLTKDIQAPIMITDPEGEQFWQGQSKELFDAVKGTKVIVPFTKAEGADLHIEPMGRSLLEQRMYDWLDEILAV
jgi:hypothetical protein